MIFQQTFVDAERGGFRCDAMTFRSVTFGDPAQFDQYTEPLWEYRPVSTCEFVSSRLGPRFRATDPARTEQAAQIHKVSAAQSLLLLGGGFFVRGELLKNCSSLAQQFLKFVVVRVFFDKAREDLRGILKS